jgi:hypothetical protein
MTAAMKTSKAAATEIRKDIKAAFPSVKFSVTTKFQGGNVISVSWDGEAGPAKAEVRNVVKKYQGFTTDPMDDTLIHNATAERYDVCNIFLYD